MSRLNSSDLSNNFVNESISITQQIYLKLGEDSSQLQKFKKKSLPLDFAQQILEYDMDIEMKKDIDINLIHRLIELYMQGAEYYESINDPRFPYFQRKINNLLLRPNTLDSMTRSNNNQETKVNSKQEINKQIEVQQKKETMKNNLICFQKNVDNDVQVIVKTHDQDTKQNDEIIKNDIQEQMKKIKDRQQKRKQKTLIVALSQTSFSEQGDQDIKPNNNFKFPPDMSQITSIIESENIEINVSSQNSSNRKEQKKSIDLTNNVANVYSRRRNISKDFRKVRNLIFNKNDQKTRSSSLDNPPIQRMYSDDEEEEDEQYKYFQQSPLLTYDGNEQDNINQSPNNCYKESNSSTEKKKKKTKSMHSIKFTKVNGEFKLIQPSNQQF